MENMLLMLRKIVLNTYLIGFKCNSDEVVWVWESCCGGGDCYEIDWRNCEMNRIKYDSEIVTPDVTNNHNYLLDTSAINDIAKNMNDLDLLIQSKMLGYKYYKTTLQVNELNGRGAKTLNSECRFSGRDSSPEWLIKKMPLFEMILDKLEVQRVTSAATLLLNHTFLDGTFRMLEDGDKPTELLSNILNLIDKKPKLKREKPFSYYYDAMIAEAAMYHSCFLITNDNEMFIEVNRLFQGRAVKYADFMREVKILLNGNTLVEKIM